MAYLIVPGIGDRMREAYRNGRFPPRYPMPAVIPEQPNSYYPVPALRTDMLYWRMPSYPTSELIAQYRLWRQGMPHHPGGM